VEKRGSFYSYAETRLGQGRENVKTFLRDNPDMAADIENQVREAAGLGQLVPHQIQEESAPDQTEEQDDKQVSEEQITEGQVALELDLAKAAA
jgi:recombination protein RecA